MYWFGFASYFIGLIWDRFLCFWLAICFLFLFPVYNVEWVFPDLVLDRSRSTLLLNIGTLRA